MTGKKQMSFFSDHVFEYNLNSANINLRSRETLFLNPSSCMNVFGVSNVGLQVLLSFKYKYFSQKPQETLLSSSKLKPALHKTIAGSI